MSPSANVEVVQAGIGAINRGDLDAVRAIVAPDFEFDGSRSVGPDNAVYSHDDAFRLFSRLGEDWETTRLEPHEFLERGDHVVVPWTWHVRGRDGISVEARTAWVWTVREGLVTRLTMYQSREDALADLEG